MDIADDCRCDKCAYVPEHDWQLTRVGDGWLCLICYDEEVEADQAFWDRVADMYVARDNETSRA